MYFGGLSLRFFSSGLFSHEKRHPRFRGVSFLRRAGMIGLSFLALCHLQNGCELRFPLLVVVRSFPTSEFAENSFFLFPNCEWFRASSFFSGHPRNSLPLPYLFFFLGSPSLDYITAPTPPLWNCSRSFPFLSCDSVGHRRSPPPPFSLPSVRRRLPTVRKGAFSVDYRDTTLSSARFFFFSFFFFFETGPPPFIPLSFSETSFCELTASFFLNRKRTTFCRPRE